MCLYKIYTKYPKLSLPEKCLVGSLIITSLEFAVGCVVNLMMGLKVWDYSKLPMNFLGQICLLYSVMWGLLCIPISGVCSLINRRKNIV